MDHINRGIEKKKSFFSFNKSIPLIFAIVISLFIFSYSYYYFVILKTRSNYEINAERINLKNFESLSDDKKKIILDSKFDFESKYTLIQVINDDDEFILQFKKSFEVKIDNQIYDIGQIRTYYKNSNLNKFIELTESNLKDLERATVSTNSKVTKYLKNLLSLFNNHTTGEFSQKIIPWVDSENGKVLNTSSLYQTSYTNNSIEYNTQLYPIIIKDDTKFTIPFDALVIEKSNLGITVADSKNNFYHYIKIEPISDISIGQELKEGDVLGLAHKDTYPLLGFSKNILYSEFNFNILNSYQNAIILSDRSTGIIITLENTPPLTNELSTTASRKQVYQNVNNKSKSQTYTNNSTTSTNSQTVSSSITSINSISSSSKSISTTPSTSNSNSSKVSQPGDLISPIKLTKKICQDSWQSPFKLSVPTIAITEPQIKNYNTFAVQGNHNTDMYARMTVQVYVNDKFPERFYKADLCSDTGGCKNDMEFKLGNINPDIYNIRILINRYFKDGSRDDSKYYYYVYNPKFDNMVICSN